MEYEFPRWKALVPYLTAVLSLVVFALFREPWVWVGCFLGLTCAMILGPLRCCCPGCGAAMLVRGGLNPFAAKPCACRSCGAHIRLK